MTRFGKISLSLIVGVAIVTVLTVSLTSIAQHNSLAATAESSLPETQPDTKDILEPVVHEDVFDYEVKEGDTFMAVMQLVGGMVYEDALQLLADAEDQEITIDVIRVGEVLHFVSIDDELVRVEYDANSEEEIVLTHTPEGWEPTRVAIEYERKERVVEGTVTDTLWSAGIDAGLSEDAILRMADIFAYQIDFVTNIREGDSFKVVYEDLYRDGERVGTGRLFAASFINDGEEFIAYRVEDENGDIAYYDEDGESTERMFLKTPLNYRRISSGFSYKRVHPVTGASRPHYGVDFAAPTGTVIESTGNGTVTFAGWANGYGKLIKIKHANGYETRYGHLSAINVSQGERVSQGEIIGKVGSTGLSTGPHLHYEMRRNGDPIDPMNANVPSGETIASTLQGELERVVADYKARVLQ